MTKQEILDKIDVISKILKAIEELPKIKTETNAMPGKTSD